MSSKSGNKFLEPLLATYLYSQWPGYQVHIETGEAPARFVSSVVDVVTPIEPNAIVYACRIFFYLICTLLSTPAITRIIT